VEEVEPTSVTADEALGTKNKITEEKLKVEGRKKNSDEGQN